MERNEQIIIMDKHGFTSREINWIVKRASILGVSIDDFLVELASAFPKILKCHIVVAVIMVGYIVLDPESRAFDKLLSYVAVWLICCACITSQGPLIKSFKSYRMLKKIKKGVNK